MLKDVYAEQSFPLGFLEPEFLLILLMVFLMSEWGCMDGVSN